MTVTESDQLLEAAQGRFPLLKPGAMVYISLLGPSGNEVQYPGYQRAMVRLDDEYWYLDWYAGEATLRNRYPISFPKAEGGAEWAYRFGFGDTAIASEPLFDSDLLEPLYIIKGKEPQFGVGCCAIALYSLDDEDGDDG